VPYMRETRPEGLHGKSTTNLRLILHCLSLN